ncbi:unnamed protein product [uncultured virus]|nr:unnamed protein product [uncultured virus]
MTPLVLGEAHLLLGVRLRVRWADLWLWVLTVDFSQYRSALAGLCV